MPTRTLDTAYDGVGAQGLLFCRRAGEVSNKRSFSPAFEIECVSLNFTHRNVPYYPEDDQGNRNF